MLAAVAAAVALHQWPYASMDEAAKAALTEAAACSAGVRECGVAIYEWLEPGSSRRWYFYSAIETSNKPFGVEITALGLPPPTHMRLVADAHIHVCLPQNRPYAPFFSVGDVLVNQAMHTVGYMADLCSMNIHRYDPAQDDADDEEIDFSSGRKLYLTIGHVVGWLGLRRISK